MNSHLEVSVTDTGAGIVPEFLPHVFERFRQADGSTTRKHGGLGLGLSIVKQLVELHGGIVRVKSAGEGKGAIFSVELPLAPVRDETKRVHPKSPRASEATELQFDIAGVRVLVVDDEQDARQMIKRVLERAKATVFLAASADEGIQAVRTQRPDVILSDIGMPERDGYDFIRVVRGFSADEGGGTPAVALTAFARSEDRTRAMLAGFQVHISKPVEPTELLATVASLASRAGVRQS